MLCDKPTFMLPHLYARTVCMSRFVIYVSITIMRYGKQEERKLYVSILHHCSNAAVFFSISFSTQICSSPFYLQLLNTRNRIRGIIFFFNYDSVVIKCFRMKRCYLYVPLLCKFAGLLTCYCNKCNMPVVRINQRCSTSVYRV